MPTLLLSAKPMKHGQKSSRMPPAAKLKDVYAPVDAFGQGKQAQSQRISANSLGQNKSRPIQSHSKKWPEHAQGIAGGWGTFRIIPMESGRGCPYGCEFCTVTGFFRRLHTLSHQRKRGE